MLLAAVQSSGARRWEVGVSCLLHTERHRSGPACSMRVGLHKDQGLCRGRSAPSAVSRSHASGSQWETLVSYSLAEPWPRHLDTKPRHQLDTSSSTPRANSTPLDTPRHPSRS